MQSRCKLSSGASKQPPQAERMAIFGALVGRYFFAVMEIQLFPEMNDNVVTNGRIWGSGSYWHRSANLQGSSYRRPDVFCALFSCAHDARMQMRQVGFDRSLGSRGTGAFRVGARVNPYRKPIRSNIRTSVMGRQRPAKVPNMRCGASVVT
jgi:hypothetical protein